jgi:hypothetical protein
MTAWPLCSLSKRQLRPWQRRLPDRDGAERATHLLNLALNTDPLPRNAFDPPRLALTTQPRPACFTTALPLAALSRRHRRSPKCCTTPPSPRGHSSVPLGRRQGVRAVIDVRHEMRVMESQLNTAYFSYCCKSEVGRPDWLIDPL